MTKTLTEAQIRLIAKQNNIPYAALRAVIEVECRGTGFSRTGEPVILFERHVFYKRLGAHRRYLARQRAYRDRPDICNPYSGGYGGSKSQHRRMQAAVRYHRVSALESASWGIGQVMGYHWKKLGYPSLQSFINDMYHSELKQLEAMIRYIRVFGLLDELRERDYVGFAYGYNGPKHYKHNYAGRMAKAERRFA